MKLRDPKKKCCKNPDVKNEGCVKIDGKTSWEYHCFSCGKTWSEKS